MTADQNRIKELEKENASLRAIVEDLLEKVNKLQNRKNSNNSSIPSSKDENRPRKTKSLRKSSGKMSGGQKGHKGPTLPMINNPDIIIEHKPKQCSNCGSTLLDANMFISGKRQVIDIPVIRAQYSGHRVFSTMCGCGAVSSGDFPENVKAPISYGANTEALIAYMYCPVKERGCIEEKFQSLLKEELPPGMKDFETFQNRMLRYKEYLFTFLYHPDVPPDNNASERAIRNIKIKQKISGQFKSELGAKCFAVIRSITDTCLKNNQNVLYALKLIAKS